MTKLITDKAKAVDRKSIVAADNWRINRRLTSTWDSISKSPPLNYVYHLLVFGADNRGMRGHVAELGGLPPGSTVLDIPCGGGVLFKDLRRDHRFRYIAADISILMLQRAREEAKARGLEGVEFKKMNVSALPFEDGTVDAVASYGGFHCFPDPRGAVHEMARVLRPGGVLRGSAIVTGANRLADASIRFWCRLRVFDVSIPRAEFVKWLAEAGIDNVVLEPSGGLLYFAGTKGDR